MSEVRITVAEVKGKFGLACMSSALATLATV